ncbi:MAG TPA: S-adenosylmethionine decarboxylase [Thermodesulfobacteriota bacterium]|nr:S-adenosylmethionine decarboxylase [Thermodesulfobacteriota bacterium]
MAGVEWLLEIFECPEAVLRNRGSLERLFRTIISRMNLKPIGDAVWHHFPDTGGITGFWLLKESHLAVHSFPEFGSACLNVFCCVERPSIDWQAVLSETLAAGEIRVREYPRVYKKEVA